MAMRPICEPVELPVGAPAIAERVRIAAGTPNIGRFMHFHDVAELVLFGAVDGDFIAEGRRHRLRPGSIVFVPSMRHHDYVLGSGAMDWLLFQVDPYIVESLGQRADLAALGRPFCASPDATLRKRIAMLGEWLVDAFESGTNQADLERMVELLLVAIAAAACEEPSDHCEVPLPSDRLLPALERLRTAPAEPLSLEAAATLCSLSPTYFSRRFSQVFGMPFTDYSRIYRLHLAARRLVGSGAAVAEIAFGVGFSNPAHFTTRFRERFSMTPRAYRASARARALRQGRGNNR
jgi:AraC-like DNA-binding protein